MGDGGASSPSSDSTGIPPLHHRRTTNITTTVLAAALGVSCVITIAMLIIFIRQRLCRSRRRKSVFAHQPEKSATECMMLQDRGSYSTNPYSATNSYTSPSTTPPLPSQGQASLQISPPLPPLILVPPSPSLLKNGPQPFTLHQLELATNKFSHLNVIGSGGFGCVYRGVLADGRVAAIKKLDVDAKQGEEEFRVEIEMLSRVRAPKLLELLGYCADDENRLLVYEYMANGNLQQHLYPEEWSDRCDTFVPLDWTTRMKIALDAAKGLEYLHEFHSPPIIHRDFKCSNILLDANFNAKLSDFGLAKVGSNKVNGDVSTRVLGTHGYVAPEYVLTGHLTTKSDVYSFGVVLLEILTGRVPVDMKRPPGEGVLVSWALPRLTDREKLIDIVDPVLAGQYSMKELIQVAAIAAMCIQPESDYRPLMIDVVQSLTPLVKQRFQTK